MSLDLQFVQLRPSDARAIVRVVSRASDGPTGPETAKHGAVAVQHDEGSVLVRQPTQGLEGHHSVRADHYQSLQSVPDAGKPTVSTIHADAVVEN